MVVSVVVNAPRLVQSKDALGRPAKGLESSGHPVIVDFLSPSLQHRVRRGVDAEVVVKVTGIKKSERSQTEMNLVCDFTAGLGVDAFLLAMAGFQVISFERDPVVYALLEDGLRRLKQTESELNLQFVHQDVALGDEASRVKLLMCLPRRPSVVYLDPMYENSATKSKSLPKKEMAALRQLMAPSTPTEVENLLATALWLATERVVVKRPVGAEPVDGPKRPSHRYQGKTACFDIYACR